jgi:hypothetical protein
MFGRVDRGGSREGKNKSLRKNKIAIKEALKSHSKVSGSDSKTITESPQSPALASREHPERFFFF